MSLIGRRNCDETMGLLNLFGEIETHQTRQCFFNLLLSNFGEPVRIVASVSCS